jgi:hypothetical protein
MTAFELNEKLKEECILLGATKCITIFRKKGVYTLEDPFYENIIYIPPKTETAFSVYKSIIDYRDVFEYNDIQFTTPVLDGDNSGIVVVYGIFTDEKNFETLEVDTCLFNNK